MLFYLFFKYQYFLFILIWGFMHLLIIKIARSVMRPNTHQKKKKIQKIQKKNKKTKKIQKQKLTLK